MYRKRYSGEPIYKFWFLERIVPNFCAAFLYLHFRAYIPMGRALQALIQREPDVALHGGPDGWLRPQSAKPQ
jgi:hypothetical protein